MPKVFHHNAKAPYLFGIGTVDIIFSCLCMRQAYYVESHFIFHTIMVQYFQTILDIPDNQS
jgi:hypothetical protein